MKKKFLFTIFFLLLILSIGGVIYWNYITSPEYSLLKIKESIDNHDITTFEKYVDIDGIIMRALSEIPEVIGKEKETGFFGEEINQLIMSVLQGPITKIAKESLRAFIERGHFDKKFTEKGAISKLLQKVPLDSFKFISLKEIRKEGKICKVPLQIYIEAYDGDTVVELMMRDKGSYWCRLSHYFPCNSQIKLHSKLF
jgi:hypothetical protein